MVYGAAGKTGRKKAGGNLVKEKNRGGKI